MSEYGPREVNDVKPTSLNHIVGQRSVVEQVSVALDAAQMDTRPFEHALLVGPPGLGKTSVAQVIAAEMAGDYFEVLGQSIKHPSDLHAVLLAATDRSIVFVDEAHELRAEYQTALYLALDKKKVILSGGSKSGNTPQSIPLANFSLLLATTDEHCLLAPLRDRMRLVLRFQHYEEEDLVRVLQHRSKALMWDADDGVYDEIARRAKGVPRLSLRLMQSCWRVARSEGETCLSPRHLQRACDLEQIDGLGLGPVEQKYLAALAAGNSRLNVLATILGLRNQTVTQVIEPFLIRSGLVVKDDQGRRQLTSKGREHLSESRPEVV
jgi:Holliday junction DNA helicase RuvB